MFVDEVEEAASDGSTVGPLPNKSRQSSRSRRPYLPESSLDIPAPTSAEREANEFQSVGIYA